MNTIQIIGIKGLPIIKMGDNIATLICDAAKRQGAAIQEDDIFVITHVVVSRAEGKIVNLDDVVPSEFAENIAKQFGKDPALVEVVLRESVVWLMGY
jgi:coenzyme F420-0:L-glutamate ligase/coenzyme F420-1:gamma-L-glutamate ligase